MSDIEMEKLWEKLYEEHLEEVSKRIKDIGKAEQEARLLTDEQVQNMQWKNVVNAMAVLMQKLNTENSGIAMTVIELSFVPLIKRKYTENGLYGVHSQLMKNWHKVNFNILYT